MAKGRGRGESGSEVNAVFTARRVLGGGTGWVLPQSYSAEELITNSLCRHVTLQKQNILRF